MSSRDPGDLSSETQLLFRSFMRRCAQDEWLVKNDITITVTATYRSMAEQELLYKQGRTPESKAQKEKIVTNARGGQSRHNATDHNGRPASTAIDIVPLRHGVPVWGTKGDGIDDIDEDDHSDDREVWERVGKIGEEVGLRWLGRKDSPFPDLPHFEFQT